MRWLLPVLLIGILVSGCGSTPASEDAAVKTAAQGFFQGIKSDNPAAVCAALSVPSRQIIIHSYKHTTTCPQAAKRFIRSLDPDDVNQAIIDVNQATVTITGDKAALRTTKPGEDVYNYAEKVNDRWLVTIR